MHIRLLGVVISILGEHVGAQADKACSFQGRNLFKIEETACGWIRGIVCLSMSFLLSHLKHLRKINLLSIGSSPTLHVARKQTLLLLYNSILRPTCCLAGWLSWSVGLLIGVLFHALGFQEFGPIHFWQVRLSSRSSSSNRSSRASCLVCCSFWSFKHPSRVLVQVSGSTTSLYRFHQSLIESQQLRAETNREHASVFCSFILAIALR